MRFDIIVTRPGFNVNERVGYGIDEDELGVFLRLHPHKHDQWCVHVHPSQWTEFKGGDCAPKAG